MELSKLLYDTDAEIIEEYCNSMSNRAANAFVRKYSSFVYFTALRYTKSEQDAEDISQEVFIKALSNLHKFNRKSTLKTWLYTITANYCKNYLRKKKIKTFLRIDSKDSNLDILDDYNANPYHQLVNSEEEKQLIDEIDKLPLKQREVFYLRYYEDLSYKEISEITGTSVGGLKANYYHAVNKVTLAIKNLESK